jgi:hypothetical protein
MKEELVTARKHPAALASVVMAGVAVTALALVTIAYLVGWIPTRGALPSAPGAMAHPGQQLAGTGPGGVDLLPGETLVAPAEAPQAQAAPPRPALPLPTPQPQPQPQIQSQQASQPKPSTPQYVKPAPSTSSTTYAQVLPSRAAPGKPAYNRGEAPLTSFERSTRNICVNCGVVSSIGSEDGDWEVRVRFEDGSTETLRYPDRPRLRIGERVHLEDGRLVRE